MDVARFEQSPAGRLVKVHRAGDAEFWAFVPNPLPPELDLDLGLSRTLSAADRAVGELEGLARSLRDPHIFVRPLIRSEAVVSSRIEGTQADLADLFVYEAGQLPLRSDQPLTPQDDVHEVLNYVRAMEYGLERRETFPVSGRFIRELHAILMEGVRGEHHTPGEFRTSPNWIGPPGCPLNEARCIFPPPGDELNSSLSDFERYLHTERMYPPLVELALIHYQFEAIHPFLDGNGRIGRLLLALLLVHWGLLSQPLLYLSEYFERNRDDYYDLLFAVSTRGAWREWVEFFLLGVTEQAQMTNRRAHALLDLQEEWHERLKATTRSAAPFHLADHLLQQPFLTVGYAERMLGFSYTAARKNVHKLVDAEILHQWGERKREKRFFAKEVLQILLGTGDLS